MQKLQYLTSFFSLVAIIWLSDLVFPVDFVKIKSTSYADNILSFPSNISSS